VTDFALSRDIKRLQPELHLFCPRQNDEDFDRYEYDTSGNDSGEVGHDPDMLQRIQDARERNRKFMDAMEILAFDGPEAEPYKNYIWDRLNDAMSKCDLCIPAYYIAKMQLSDRLQQRYGDEEIGVFFGIIDNVDKERIIKGLDRAKNTLLSVPEHKRNLSCLDQASLFSIFEALSCDALLRDEALLQQHFDEPFKLIQGKRPLKTRDYVPAATRFLFDSNQHRFNWASAAWPRFERPPSDEEWNWTTKDFLQKRFLETYEQRLPGTVLRLWNGLRFIVARLDPPQITHNLRALEPDIAKMALEHFAVKTPGLRFIIQTVKMLLEKAPADFWDALGSISAATVVEQIFTSPFYEKLLQDTSRSLPELGSAAVDMLSWIPPFLSSLKPPNQPSACRVLAAQLFKRAYKTDLLEQATTSCYKAALNVILQTLRQFADSPELRQSVGRFVLSDTLDIVSQHVVDIVQKPPVIATANTSLEDVKLLRMDAVRNSLDVECQILKSDFQSLASGQVLQQGLSSYSPDIWFVVVQNLHSDDIKLSEATLRGTLALPGLEKIVARRSKVLPEDALQFNAIYGKITNLLKQVLERLADFAPEHLDHLFKAQETSMPLISALFSADHDTYVVANELVKNVSGQPAQKEALSHLLRAFPGTTLYSLSWSFRRIAAMRTFSPVPRLLKMGMDILDILTDTQAGLLRVSKLESRDIHAAQSYWMYQWQVLKTVFKETERWHTLYHDKELMTEVCRDAMQYAEALFEQYDVFASAILCAKAEFDEDVDKLLLEKMSGSPASTLQAMSKWLRLRDEYLSATLVKLITKMLRRLSDHDIKVPTEGIDYIEQVATKKTVKTMLSDQQKAELVRALEIYYKKPIVVEEPVKKQKSLTEWTRNILKTDVVDSSASTSRAQSVDEFDDASVPDKDLYELSKSVELSKAQRQATKAADKGKFVKPDIAKSVTSKVKKPVAPPPKPKAEVSAFLETRRRETEARKARDREAAAQLRGKMGIGEQTKGQGSGLSGIGVTGKDHAVPGEGMMVSSGSESDSDDDDIELFGSKVKTMKQTSGGIFSEMVKVTKMPQGPVKKIKRVLHRNDMRARLAADLSGLHQTILSWDFFADTELPPDSAKDDYTLVSNTFSTVLDYQKTFEPLLVLEGWQSFRSAREDGNFKPFEVKVSNRLSVDNSVEVSSTMSKVEGKDLGLNPADIVLLSKAPRPHSSPDQPHCLARVKEKNIKQGQFEIVLRVNARNNSLLSSLAPGTAIWGSLILSLTPLEREYGALYALQHYDLQDEVISAKPSPILDYSDDKLQPLVENYNVNTAQAKAVRSALDNDAFTLIQGPPGSGKTKTICALVGAMMTGAVFDQSANGSRTSGPANGRPSTLRAKKILVCAPSNAAVDELVMRFKNGIKTLDGRNEKLSVVRLGRSDAINANIKDVTLEELVNAKLSLAAPKQAGDRDIHDIMMEHKDTSDKLHTLRTQVDGRRAKGESVSQADTQAVEGLKRKKANLSLQIDNARDKQKTASRDAELARKRIQQQILDSAHVLCATLSGSGHEIFRSLEIEFETVIIDEAAQSIELSALIPLKYGCSKCILVGDPKQLPPTVLSKEAARFQFEQSLFARMEKNNPKDVHLLDTQYRMHPEISSYPSKTFYDSRLKDGADMAKYRARPWHHAPLLAPYRFFDVQGMQSSAAKGHSLINIAELEVAMQLYDRLTTDCRGYDFKGKIGIITPYKGQLKELRSRFSRRYGEGILSAVEFNTTDAFQGRESEIIIFSCVRATTKGIGFLSDIRRMNVGLTRAKSSLWVLGDSKTLVNGEFWRGLITDAKARNLYTDGDVPQLLQRPLLTMDMMREDIEMQDAEPTELPGRSPTIDAPLDRRQTNGSVKAAAMGVTSKSASSGLKDASDPSAVAGNAGTVRKGKLNARASSSGSGSVEETGTSPHKTARSSASGSVDLADQQRNATCRLCGSHNHFTHACDNPTARATAHGTCLRCSSSLHSSWDCTEDRCFECGEIGHPSASCKAPLNLRLGKTEKDRIRKQEEDFAREKARAKQRRAARQLGDHGATVPKVRSTLSTSGKAQGPTAVKTSGSAAPDPKRKRDEVSPVDAPRRPKAMRPSDGPVDLTESDEGKLKRNKGLSRPGGSAARPPLGASRPGPAGGVHVKRKPKDSDVFMKRK
jgi:senataxin